MMAQVSGVALVVQVTRIMKILFFISSRLEKHIGYRLTWSTKESICKCDDRCVEQTIHLRFIPWKMQLEKVKL